MCIEEKCSKESPNRSFGRSRHSLRGQSPFGFAAFAARHSDPDPEGTPVPRYPAVPFQSADLFRISLIGFLVKARASRESRMRQSAASGCAMAIHPRSYATSLRCASSNCLRS